MKASAAVALGVALLLGGCCGPEPPRDPLDEQIAALERRQQELERGYLEQSGNHPTYHSAYEEGGPTLAEIERLRAERRKLEKLKAERDARAAAEAN